MVWNPKREEVNVKRMMIYSIIPFLNMYSHWRIQKFWVINILLFPFEIMTQLSLNYAGRLTDVSSLYSYLPLAIAIISLALSVLLTKHFAQKYNLSVRDDITED
jgi:hypothetical protein